MIGLHAAGITDVGRQRTGNEDSLHVGDSVFAVADGMGGHQAGEVASALALEPIAALDGRVFGDVEAARTALGDAVVAANRTVVDAAAHDDALSGMGTTLTAALFEGRRLHVAHVGDSRAYLLRQGEVAQLTRDHTFVQQLLDDGRITEDEVATHPHRSVITRAIGARDDVDIDLQTIDLQHGDAVLLCSDGLSSYVEVKAIADVLRSDRSPGAIVTTLVDLANDAGGPDNITAVLLTVVNTRDDVAPYSASTDVPVAPEDEPTTGHDVQLGGTIGEAGEPGGGARTDDDNAGIAGPDDPTSSPGDRTARSAGAGEPAGTAAAAGTAGTSGTTAAGASSSAPVAASVDEEASARAPGSGRAAADGPATGDDDAGADAGATAPPPGTARPLLIRPDGDAGVMRPLPGPGPDESVVVDPAARRRRIASIVVAVAIVLGLFIGGGRWLLSRSFFVGVDGQDVVIYKGIPASLGPLELSWVFEETGLTTDLLPETQVRQLEDGIAARDGRDAREIVRNYRESADAADEPSDQPSAGDGASPSPGDGASPGGDEGSDPDPTETTAPGSSSGATTSGTA